MIKDKVTFDIKEDRFRVTYLIYGEEAEARSKAWDICLEQTVEFPEELVPEGMIRDHIVGRIEAFEMQKQQCWQAVISYHADTTAFELTQLLNVVFGNISIKPNIRVEKLELCPSLLAAFKGPRFGREGIRKRLGIRPRPILATALKPMGLSSRALADLAYQFALGGIDIIKDDHGLTDQRYAPFEERAALCAEAVHKANRETGLNCIYVPNVTAPYDKLFDRAKLARRAGAGGLLISPGIVGLDAVRALADNDEIDLPIISHPAFQGSFVTGSFGISHHALFGQLARLAGADATIYPNYGGRFSFSKEECKSIVAGTSEEMGHIRPIFPSPGGGMTIDKVPDMLETYGKDVIFLIGGGLFKHGPDLVENSRYFSKMIDV